MFGFKKSVSEKPLKIIVVGYGKVGRTIIDQLCKEGNDVTLIEKKEVRISDATSQYDILAIHGNGASYDTLKEAGVKSADVIIAVTTSDELNLLCCTVAATINENCSTIARVRTPDYSAEVEYFKDKLGIAMVINPEREAAREISYIINLPAALEVNSFAHGGADMVRYKLQEGDSLSHKVLHEYMSVHKLPLIFCAVEREGTVVIPNGNFLFLPGDIVTFVSHRNDCLRNLTALGVNTNPVDTCMIIGGGNTAYYLALHLQRAAIETKIIEQDAKRCRQLSTLLPHATIINGDGTDISLLHEEGLAYADAVVTLTGIDEENILLTLHAKNVSNAKTITKISRFSFPEVLSELDLGSIIYPRLTIAEYIVAYVRAKRATKESNIETMYHLFDNQAEAIEFVINEESAITGIPLKELKLVENLIIAFIARNGKLFFPSGQDTIEIGDSVMVVTTHSGFDDILKILA